MRTTATALSAASRDIMQDNQQLEERTRTQADSLERTVASMRGLAANVHDNATNALHAQEQTDEARRIVDTGSTAVAGVAAVMGEIQREARKISEITGLIDSIAFQTNILALNAAVEAARAGESGRGFAVVATEVRALAQRSASAAREIRGLIDGSLEKTDSGFRQADHAASVIREVVVSIERVAGIVGQIGDAGRAQATDIDEVNRAVTLLDELTRQNAARIAQAAGASTALQTQAAQLLQAVSVFRLQDEQPPQTQAAPRTEPQSRAAPLALTDG